MTRPTDTMTEAELAEYYNTTGDLSEFDGGEQVVVDSAPAGTRSVTLSIRLSPEELELLAARAEAAGRPLTAYIRMAALEAERPIDTEAIRDELETMEVLLAKLVGRVGSSGRQPTKRAVKAPAKRAVKAPAKRVVKGSSKATNATKATKAIKSTGRASRTPARRSG